MAYKLVLLGDGRVGKTSLVSRFAEDRFSQTEESTVKAQMFKKARVMVEGRGPVEVSVWDTAGQERFHALGPLYYRNADGAVLVYDITDSDSFDRVRAWVKELKKTVGDDIVMVLCGNKCDLEKDRTVTEEQAVALARKYDATHFYTSAKLDLRVQDAFIDVITRAVRKRQGGDGSPFGSSSAAAQSGGNPDALYGDFAGSPSARAGGASGAGGKKKRGLVIDTDDTPAAGTAVAPDDNVVETTSDRAGTSPISAGESRPQLTSSHRLAPGDDEGSRVASPPPQRSAQPPRAGNQQPAPSPPPIQLGSRPLTKKEKDKKPCCK